MVIVLGNTDLAILAMERARGLEDLACPTLPASVGGGHELRGPLLLGRRRPPRMVPQDPGVGENALQETPQTQGEGRHASCEVRVPEATAARLLLQRWPDIEDEDAADSLR